jgi:hypothetical protein
LLENYSETDATNCVPCADLYETYLANGWQGEENCPDLKPVDASTFGRVIKKVFPNVFPCCDGGQANRSFIQLHFKGKDAVREK